MPVYESRGKRHVDAAGVRDTLINIGPVDEVMIEDVRGVQGAGATSSFTFGRGVGILEGVTVALGRPLAYVTPQLWTRALGVGPDKGAHREAARRRWPDQAMLFTRSRDDGRADAALIALWAWRQHTN